MFRDDGPRDRDRTGLRSRAAARADSGPAPGRRMAALRRRIRRAAQAARGRRPVATARRVETRAEARRLERPRRARGGDAVDALEGPADRRLAHGSMAAPARLGPLRRPPWRA